MTGEPLSVRVSVTWSPYPNRATDAPYTIYDTPSPAPVALATIPVDQQQAPSDFIDHGVGWKDLGTYQIIGEGPIVGLSDSANGYVIADAVRFQIMGGSSAPSITSLADSPDPVTAGGALTLTAGGVGTFHAATSVSFYRESNSIPGLQPGGGDALVGTATSGSGGNWSVVVSTAGLAAGTYTYYAQATNAAGLTSNPVSTTNTVQAGGSGSVQVVDDGDPGWAAQGGWAGTTGQGFLNDVHYMSAGGGGNYTDWTFPVTPGQTYRVSATYSPFSNRATNAPYTVYDGSTPLGSVPVNQQAAPADLTDQGVGWDDLGTFTVSTSTLRVRLSDAANGYVISDAVRIQLSPPRVGTLTDSPDPVGPGGAMTLTAGSVSANAASVSFYRESNSIPGLQPGAGGDALVGTATSGSGGNWSVVASTAGLAAGTYTYYAQAADGQGNTGMAGTPAPSTTNTVQGSGPTSVQIVDDGDPGWAAQGGWTGTTGQGYLGDVHYMSAGGGGNYTDWTLSALAPGTYQVAATWPAYPNRATNAPYYVYDGSTPIPGPIRLNQQQSPSGFADQGVPWQVIGTFTISTSTLRVRLSDDANGYVMSDAIRVQSATTAPGTISGTAYNDANGNGAADVGDPGQSGWTVYLDANGNGNLDPGETHVTTDAAGFYSFTGLAAGSYVVRESSPGPSPSDWTQSSPAGRSFTVNLTSGATVSGRDFGNTHAFRGTPVVIDDGDPGFSTVGPWQVATDQGYKGDVRYVAAGSGSATASWTFTVPTGVYFDVFVSWTAFPNRATDAPYTFYDGNTAVRSRAMNQQHYDPGYTYSYNGSAWTFLFSDFTTTGTLTIKLSNQAGGYVIADAVAIGGSGGLAGQALRGTPGVIDDGAPVTVTVVPWQVPTDLEPTSIITTQTAATKDRHGRSWIRS